MPTHTDAPHAVRPQALRWLVIWPRSTLVSERPRLVCEAPGRAARWQNDPYQAVDVSDQVTRVGAALRAFDAATAVVYFDPAGGQLVACATPVPANPPPAAPGPWLELDCSHAWLPGVAGAVAAVRRWVASVGARGYRFIAAHGADPEARLWMLNVAELAELKAVIPGGATVVDVTDQLLDLFARAVSVTGPVEPVLCVGHRPAELRFVPGDVAHARCPPPLRFRADAHFPFRDRVALDPAIPMPFVQRVDDPTLKSLEV